MSSGPEHYKEAERLVGTIEAHKLGSNETFAAIEIAQVHATLALAAATVAAREVGPLGDFGAEWRRNTVQDSAWIEATS